MAVRILLAVARCSFRTDREARLDLRRREQRDALMARLERWLDDPTERERRRIARTGTKLSQGVPDTPATIALAQAANALACADPHRVPSIAAQGLRRSWARPPTTTIEPSGLGRRRPSLNTAWTGALVRDAELRDALVSELVPWLLGH